MRNNTPRKSKYTKSVGTAMMLTWLESLILVAKMDDKLWIKMANMINHRNYIPYGVAKYFKDVTKMVNLKEKISDMNAGNHDLQWLLANRDMANLLMALATEQSVNTSRWSVNYRIEIHNDWNDNVAMRYLDSSHPANHRDTAGDMDYQ